MIDRNMISEQLIAELLRLKLRNGQSGASSLKLPVTADDSFVALLLDTVPTGVSIIDADDRRYVFVNRRGIEILGSDPSALSLDEHLQQLRILMPDGQSPMALDDLPLVQTLKTGMPVRQREMVIEHPDKSHLSLLVNSTPIRDESGSIRLVVIGFMDVTQLKQAERTAQESHEQTIALIDALRKAERNRNRYLNMLSHELRNPLAAIVLGQSLLKRLPADSEQARRTMETIDRQTAQLTRLVDDLLDVTRINENRILLRKTSVDIVDLVREAMSDLDAQFAAKKVSYRAVLPSRPLILHVDRARLAQAVGNVLHNALKFTSSGDDVVVTVRRDASHACISIKDTGVGIPTALLPDIFTPFAQADNSLDRSQGGLGLGLAITKGLVGLHGGSVKARSDGPGKGAEFMIILPLMECSAEADACLLE